MVSHHVVCCHLSKCIHVKECVYVSKFSRPCAAIISSLSLPSSLLILHLCITEANLYSCNN